MKKKISHTRKRFFSFVYLVNCCTIYSGKEGHAGFVFGPAEVSVLTNGCITSTNELSKQQGLLLACGGQ